MMTAIATTSRMCVRMPYFSRRTLIPAEESLAREKSGNASGDKFVPSAIDREQVLRICRVLLQFLTQLQHLIIHRARRWIEVISPYFIQQNISREHELGVFHEELEEFEFVRCEHHQVSCAQHRHFLEVDFTIAEAVGGLRRALALAADRSLHASRQLARTE